MPMRFRWRRLGPREADFEFAIGVLFVPLHSLAVVLFTLVPWPVTPICLFHRLTGWPCPTCGAYRSVRLLASGEISQAWLMQPAVVTVAAAAALFSLYSWIVVVGRLPRLRVHGITRRQRRVLVAGVLLLVLLNWLYLVWRGV